MKLTLEIEIAFRYEKKKPSGKENSQLTPDKRTCEKRKYYDGKEGKKLRKMISRFPFGTTDCDKLKRKSYNTFRFRRQEAIRQHPSLSPWNLFCIFTRLGYDLTCDLAQLRYHLFGGPNMTWLRPVLAISFNVSMTPRTSSAQVAHRCVASARLAILHQQLFL